MSLTDYNVKICKMPVKQYIYCITNTTTHKAYVGRTNNIERRFIEHLTGKGSTELLKDIVCLGVSHFLFEVIAEIYREHTDIDALEDSFIKSMNTLHPHGYNKRINRAIVADDSEINLNNIPIIAKYVFESHSMKIFTIGELSQARAYQLCLNILNETESQKLKVKTLFNFTYLEIMIQTEREFTTGEIVELTLKYNFIEDLFFIV